MLAVSSRWAAEVAGPHRAICRADIMWNGDVIQQGVAIVAGSVTMDRTALVRGRCSVTFAEPTLIPTGATSRLAPFGAEIKLWRGVHYLDGSEELVPWGVFGIQKSNVGRRDLATRVDGLDRMQLVIDAGIEAEMKITAGTNVVTAAQALLVAAWPGVTFRADPTDFTTPEVVVSADDDPAQRALDLVQSAGMEVFFDHDGVCVIQDEPAQAQPVATVSEGAGGTLVDLELSLDRGDAVNRVVAVGNHSASTAAIVATATDYDPTSPTFWDGPFGRKPIKITSPLYTAVAQAQAAADAALLKRRGVPKVIEFDMVPNPALVAGDAVEVHARDLVPWEVHVIDRITMPMAPSGGAVSMSTRAVLVG